jgi:hypothetical protein
VIFKKFGIESENIVINLELGRGDVGLFNAF